MPVPKPLSLLLLDVDGTIARPASGAVFRKEGEEWVLLPHRAERLAEFKDVKGALVSNQAGVAFGYVTYADVARALERLTLLIREESGFDPFPLFCPYHPDATEREWLCEPGDPERKPGPGMLLEAMTWAGAPPLESCLMVGDRPEDQGAAQAAGVPFMWADVFFADPQFCHRCHQLLFVGSTALPRGKGLIFAGCHSCSQTTQFRIEHYPATDADALASMLTYQRQYPEVIEDGPMVPARGLNSPPENGRTL